jgi:hypothetical protein
MAVVAPNLIRPASNRALIRMPTSTTTSLLVLAA